MKLYHGTTREKLPEIEAHGLPKGTRLHHDEEVARWRAEHRAQVKVELPVVIEVEGVRVRRDLTKRTIESLGRDECRTKRVIRKGLSWKANP